jgi:hypothetical protein
MTKFEQKSFSTPANSQAYIDNWETTFGKPDEPVCEHCGQLACLLRSDSPECVAKRNKTEPQP